MTDHIVKEIKIGGVEDKDSTIISFNDQAFAFSYERLQDFHKLIHDRIEFLRLLKKAKG
ncbi:hypothetical protein [Roseibium sp.]|uniref:hypothetical protein n=1 Tax=Roseibium sp. TaxID=1936156 RepID=UPI003B5165D4